MTHLHTCCGGLMSGLSYLMHCIDTPNTISTAAIGWRQENDVISLKKSPDEKLDKIPGLL